MHSAQKKYKRPIPVELELDNSSGISRRRKAVGARSRARVASVREVPRPVAAG